jgi:uncharacterized protein YqeY
MIHLKIKEAWKLAMRTCSSSKTILSAMTAEIKNQAIAKGEDRESPSDALAIDTISKMSKQRTDNAETYRQAGREDLALVEDAERSVIARYLPTQFSEEEVRAMIGEIISAQQLKTASDSGKVMKEISPKIKGKFDGKLAAQLAKSMLESSKDEA